jgi:hypothetical protein
MRRKNKVVTLQWEKFSGTLCNNGAAALVVCQGICSLPPCPVVYVISLQYNGKNRLGLIEVSPYTKLGNIRFYFNIERCAESRLRDTISVPASTISWIVDD